MKDKQELVKEINNEIREIKQEINNLSSTETSDAINRVAISNLYIALSNLTK